MADIGELREGLAAWAAGARGALLAVLGYRSVGLRVPREGLADFGLDAADPLDLEVAAAMDGFHVFLITLHGPLESESIRRIAGALYRHNPARRALLFFTGSHDPRLVAASWGLGPGPFRLQKLWVDPKAPRRSELDVLAGLAVDGRPSASELAYAHVRALDREAVTRKFFAEFRRHRSELAAALTGPADEASQDRLDLALILLTRLLFIYFIQRKGWLAADPDYLRHLYEEASQAGQPYYRGRLVPLFFSALNREPEWRGRRARALGPLPYLNGGLFERHPLERKYPKLDVPDAEFGPLFVDLLDKYQFTLREDVPADQDVAIDPEMLGRVFEGLMAAPSRGTTGTFFTPRPLVDRLVDAALTARLAQAADCDEDIVRRLLEGQGVTGGAPAATRRSGGSTPGDDDPRDRLAAEARRIRVLDPAVGSGAFLLAALQRLERLRDALEGPPTDHVQRFRRRETIIRTSLYGVDLNAAAVRLCELRLWLALVVDLEVDSIAEVPPLPNLDLNIRQGDALLDPIDFLVSMADLDFPTLSGRWARELARLSQRRARYFHCAGRGKPAMQRALRRDERDLALGFVGELLEALRAQRRELRSAAEARTLFGERAGLSRRQRRAEAQLKRRAREASRLLQRLREDDALPFFSFPVHFSDPDGPGHRFHVVLANPPWVRTHRWTGPSRSRLRQRYQVLREAGWPYGSQLAGAGRGFAAQLDLSALFLERSLDLLANQGTLGFLVPAKLARALSWGGARRRLLRSTRILEIEDASLGGAALFDATAYPLRLVLTLGSPAADHTVRICVHDPHGGAMEFRMSQARLPFLKDDAAAPWALAPPSVRDVMKRMRRVGPPLGRHPGRRPMRGIVTGKNSIFMGEAGEPDDSGHLPIQLAGDRAVVEMDCVRPALRGQDLNAWRFTPTQVLIWTHDDGGTVRATLPPAMREYLTRHGPALRRRADLKPGQPWWTLFRARPAKWGLRVAWRDIGGSPGAAVIPASVPFLDGRRPLISLNTVYQIAAASEHEAHLLAAVLNSVVARTYLKAIAERAAGGYFRFLGWTAASLPFPARLDPQAADDCAGWSRVAHTAGGLDAAQAEALDDAVARLYALTAGELQALHAFDARLSRDGASG